MSVNTATTAIAGSTTASAPPGSVATSAGMPNMASSTGPATSTTATSTSAGPSSKAKDGKEKVPPQAPKLSANELERVTEVFKMYETGLREATIYPKVRVISIRTLNTFTPFTLKILKRAILAREQNGFYCAAVG